MHLRARHRLTLLALLALSAAATPVLARTTADAATAQLNGTIATKIDAKRAELTFNSPGNDAQHDQVVRLINAAPRGSAIRLGIYSIDQARIYDAIAAAQSRGVTVYAVHSGEKRATGAPNRTYAVKLKKLLRSHFHWCGHTSTASAGACISTANPGIMHAKYVLLSRTKDTSGTFHPDVVWYSSGNFTKASGIDKYNNSTTIYGDSTLYGGFISDVWNPMWLGSSYAGNDYYDAGSGRGYFGSSASNSQVYVSPEQQTDLVDSRLSYVTPGSGCQVRVMESWLRDTRSRIADRLVAFKKKGCTVRVVAEIVESSMWHKLHAAGIPMHVNPQVHDKAFVIYARYGGSATKRYVVLNGSENLSGPALRSNDELLVKLTDNATMYDAFVRHFGDAYSRGKVLTAPNGGTGDDSSS